MSTAAILRRRLAFVAIFWLAVAGVFGALLLPAACLFLIGCHINAGTQLGAGAAGVIGGGLMVFWLTRRTPRRDLKPEHKDLLIRMGLARVNGRGLLELTEDGRQRLAAERRGAPGGRPQ
jgi:hypothetical protein